MNSQEALYPIENPVIDRIVIGNTSPRSSSSSSSIPFLLLIPNRPPPPVTSGYQSRHDREHQEQSNVGEKVED
ncbi:hypothetical protein F2Q69_00056331 [Brassica cretica]|uniref:Uncharacterized protein n=1 Tax=Brassica cretica TaxID=69181 RepID=A0A8S9MZK6_BRACR|nr:hypothetical protein F2Q69_00056331 [Brassica cretica]